MRRGAARLPTAVAAVAPPCWETVTSVPSLPSMRASASSSSASPSGAWPSRLAASASSRRRRRWPWATSARQAAAVSSSRRRRSAAIERTRGPAAGPAGARGRSRGRRGRRPLRAGGGGADDLLPPARLDDEVPAVGLGGGAAAVVAAGAVGAAVAPDERGEVPEADPHVDLGMPAAALRVGRVLELPPGQLARPDALHQPVAAGDPPALVVGVVGPGDLARAREDRRVVAEDVAPARGLLLEQGAGERQRQARALGLAHGRPRGDEAGGPQALDQRRGRGGAGGGPVDGHLRLRPGPARARRGRPRSRRPDPASSSS